jgi:hypothetical protein
MTEVTLMVIQRGISVCDESLEFYCPEHPPEGQGLALEA